MSLSIDVANFKQAGHVTYTLYEEMIKIGRDDDNSIVIHETNVSRHHAIFMTFGKSITVTDLNSRNGVFFFTHQQWIKITGTQTIQLPALVMLGLSIILRIRHRDPDYAITIEDNSENPTTANPPYLKQKKPRAIMVLDMCNSSAIANKDEKMAYYLKSRLNQMSFPILYTRDVDFIKGTGDGFFATFVNSMDALHAGIELASMIKARNNVTKNLLIAYRIALHYGIVIPTDEAERDLHGNDINIAFRVEGVKVEQFSTINCDLPLTNRILCTKQFQMSLPKLSLTKGMKFIYCGAAKVKGIAEHLELFMATT